MFGCSGPLAASLTCQKPGMTCVPLLPVSGCLILIAFAIPLGILVPLCVFCFSAQLKNYHPPFDGPAPSGLYNVGLLGVTYWGLIHTSHAWFPICHASQSLLHALPCHRSWIGRVPILQYVHSQ